MCGIAGIHFKDTSKFQGQDYVSTYLERFCDELLLGIENRGTDATGFVAIGSGGASVLDKKDVAATKFIKERKKLLPDTHTVLLHTRFATKGKPHVWHNNHPVFAGTTFTVHNGTIYNDDDLFKEHKLKRVGQVDSEIIPAMLDKYTFDKAPEAFAELGGGFATASVDPVRYPGVTVLGKGGSWPLIVYDAKDFVVWASTQEAIRRAWGAVLGTPPNKGFEILGSGDVWFLNKDTIDKVPKAFVHKTRWDAQKGKGGTNSGYGSTFSDDWYDWENEDYFTSRNQPIQAVSDRSYKVPPKRKDVERFDLKDEIHALEVKDETHAIRWEDKSLPRYKDYFTKHNTGRWRYCIHCTRSVPELQASDHPQFGTTCIDCLILIGNLKKVEVAETQEQFMSQFAFDAAEWRMLTRFSDGHTYLHLRALRRVTEETGLKRNLVDFLLFRADPTYLETSKPLLELYCNLSDRYTDHMAELWDEWLEESKKDEPKEEAKQLPPGESCGVAAFEEADKREVCMRCRRKPKHWLGLKYAWCTRHFNKCSTRACKAQAIAYEPDGARRCHVHSRGVKGLIADSDTKARKRAIAL